MGVSSKVLKNEPRTVFVFPIEKEYVIQNFVLEKCKVISIVAKHGNR